MLAQVAGRGKELQSRGTAALLLVGSSLAGILGGILAFRQKYSLGDGLVFAAGVVPLFYASQAIIFTLLLIIGGTVALAAHFKAG